MSEDIISKNENENIETVALFYSHPIEIAFDKENVYFGVTENE